MPHALRAAHDALSQPAILPVGDVRFHAPCLWAVCSSAGQRTKNALQSAALSLNKPLPCSNPLFVSNFVEITRNRPGIRPNHQINGSVYKKIWPIINRMQAFKSGHKSGQIFFLSGLIWPFLSWILHLLSPATGRWVHQCCPIKPYP